MEDFTYQSAAQLNSPQRDEWDQAYFKWLRSNKYVERSR